MSWIYKQPVQIVFGNGKRKEIKSFVTKPCRPLLIADPYFVQSGLADEIADDLNADIFSDISQNPDVSEVNACVACIREHHSDILIALGGGSSLDLAKAASIVQTKIEPYHRGEKAVPKEHLPVIAIPTTSGTGSEVTCVSVLTDRSSGRKNPIFSESFYPSMAIIDPEITVSLPPYVTACTGIDVLCHAVEGYWSKGNQPICSALALHAIQQVFTYLPIAYDEADNLTAREKMSEASVMAGLAFTLPKTTSSHACSFPLTAIYHIPHGEACGLTLDHFVRYNKNTERCQTLSRQLGFSDVEAFAEEIDSLKQKLKLRRGLKELNLSQIQIKELVNASHHPNMDNNPIMVSDEFLHEMYETLSRI